jgi:hypothetical protein
MGCIVEPSSGVENARRDSVPFLCVILGDRMTVGLPPATHVYRNVVTIQTLC